MYWHETWAITRYLCAWIDAFDTWALCKILRIPYTRHITNADVSVSVSATFQHGNGMTLEILWPYRTQCSWWRLSPCSCCCDSQASIRLETASRKTQLHVAQSHWLGSETTEHRSFLHVEEGSLSRTLAFDCGHAQEEYATKRSERMCLRYKFTMNLTNVVLHNTFLMVCDVFGRATRAFQNLLYLYPDFKCCNEVHVRLGLMFKAASEHESSLKVITHTHTHTHTFNGPFSWTARVGRYQKGKTYLDFTEARDSERQWHQLGHMQVCTLLQTDNHASTSPLSFLQAGCPSCRPTNSVKALKAKGNQHAAIILLIVLLSNSHGKMVKVGSMQFLSCIFLKWYLF